MNSGVRLAVDANVLLAAAMGGSAAWIMDQPGFALFTTQNVFDEVDEYLFALAPRKRMSLARKEKAFRALPVEIVSTDVFVGSLEEPARRIGARDPDDAQLLALALHLGLPIWSNDRDFEIAGVELFTTSMPMQRFKV